MIVEQKDNVGVDARQVRICFRRSNCCTGNMIIIIEEGQGGWIQV